MRLNSSPRRPCARGAGRRPDAGGSEGATDIAAQPLVTAQDRLIVAANPLAAQAGTGSWLPADQRWMPQLPRSWSLNVVEPQSSGIGGGAFALVHGPHGLATWDARETAPAGATPDMFMENGKTLPSSRRRHRGVPSACRVSCA